jgi:protein-glutamine gamma-glutamyltransferase
MRFYWPLPNIKSTPGKRQLLDAALIIAIVPHLGIVSSLMLGYLLAGVLAIIFIPKPTPRHLVLFALFGGLALALSFYDSLTFVGLSRLNIFVSLIISLLMVAVILQRLNGTINAYLLLSPALFLGLSYFFYNSIAMLFYAIFAVFTFLLLILWHRMQSSLMAAFKMSVSMFAFALPLIVLLFMVFPRISFEPGDFGFKAPQTIRTGHDGLMHIGGDALLVPSKRVVMEVSFEDRFPKEADLYFRGSALYIDKTEHWAPRKNTTQSKILRPLSSDVHYRITLYPHHKRWVYLLDYPSQHPNDTTIDGDAITTTKMELDELLRYDGASHVSSFLPQTHLSTAQQSDALHYNASRDERTWQLVQSVSWSDNPAKRLEQLIALFRSLKLHYSLQPQGIKIDDPVDSFVFDSHQGYCVHFASAFATMSRMAGLPSRIITGFKANYQNRINNYLVIKEEDAHAWVEVYLEPKGWVRIETTALAAMASHQATQEQLNILQQPLTSPLLHRINLAYMYTRYVLQSWILDYNRSKQMQLLHSLLNDLAFGLKLIALLAALIGVGYLLREWHHTKTTLHPARHMLQPLLARLEKEGITKTEHETMEAFFNRVYALNGNENYLHVSRYYHHARYAPPNNQALKQLAKALKTLS